MSGQGDGSSGVFTFILGLVIGVCFSYMIYDAWPEKPLPETINIERDGKFIGFASTDEEESRYILYNGGVYLGFPIYGDSVEWTKKLTGELYGK